MSPFIVQKVIKESRANGERITVDTLSQRCGGRVRHRYVRLSHELFECNECGGFPRHWVEGINLRGWLFLVFSNPKNAQGYPSYASSAPIDLDEINDFPLSN